jgi:hypothetical protein
MPLGVPLACAICEKRKEKRFCPAVHGRICAQCCGEQREVTLDCPRDCSYLQQAREHERPRSVADLDQAALFPKVEIGDRFLYEQEHLILGLSYALTKAARADRAIRDSDLIASVSALAKRYETLATSGLHYETPLTNVAHQRIASEVEKIVKEYRGAEEKHLGYSKLRDVDVLYFGPPTIACLRGLPFSAVPRARVSDRNCRRGKPDHRAIGDVGR